MRQRRDVEEALEAANLVFRGAQKGYDEGAGLAAAVAIVLATILFFAKSF